MSVAEGAVPNFRWVHLRVWWNADETARVVCIFRSGLEKLVSAVPGAMTQWVVLRGGGT